MVNIRLTPDRLEVPVAAIPAAQKASHATITQKLEALHRQIRTLISTAKRN